METPVRKVIVTSCLILLPLLGRLAAAEPVAAIELLQKFRSDKSPTQERVATYWEPFLAIANAGEGAGEKNERTANHWLVEHAQYRFEASGAAEDFIERRLTSDRGRVLAPRLLAIVPRSFADPDRLHRFVNRLLPQLSDAADRARLLELCARRASFGARLDPVRRDAFYKRIIRDFNDVPTAHTTYGAIARARLEANSEANLAPGSPAPELFGSSLDGTPIRLSDYRGRPVLLRFFQDTCESCRGDYSLERSLVEENPDLVILGVSGDRHPEELRKAIERSDLDWPIIFDGGCLPGPLAIRWRATNRTAIRITADGTIEGTYTVTRKSKDREDDGSRILRPARR